MTGLPWESIGAALAGVVAGIVNSVGGGGSFLTIPILIEIGLSPTSANATNRLAVWLQCVAATSTFARHGVVPWRATFRVLPATLLGVAFGVYAATVISDDAFRDVLAAMLLIASIFLAWRTLRRARRTPQGDASRELEGRDGEGRPGRTRRSLVDEVPDRLPRWLDLAFVGIGFYGGFVQAGVGILMVIALLAARMPILQANALKIFLVLIYTTGAIAAFALDGSIAWNQGLWLMAGSAIGGWSGAKVAMWLDPRWLERALVAATLIAGLRLLGVL